MAKTTRELIQELLASVSKLDKNDPSYETKLDAINSQIMELQKQERDSIRKPPVKFGMENVDLPVSPDDVPVTPDELANHKSLLLAVADTTAKSDEPYSPLADKISGQDADKLLKMADSFLSENGSKTTMSAIEDAIEVYKQAELEKTAFKKEYSDILSEKSEKDKAVRESQRTLYGLLAKYGQTDVRIVELEGDSEGLVDLDVHNADVLPTGTGFSIKYELVANEVELWKWAIMYAPTLLVVDMKKAEALVKQYRVWSLGKKTAGWYLPLEMPPAEIVAKVLPTVGDVFAEDESSDS